MLGEVLDNLSALLGINNTILPNIITFMVVVTVLFITLKGQLSWVTLLTLYTIMMAILSLLGIDSIFNLISIVENWVTGSIVGVYYGY